ncbi:hypothetical protein BD309DRAFT_985179, partial [Dichomitus squalens]
SWNCPKRRTAKAPDVPLGSSSIRFEHLESLADRARGTDTDIRLGSISIETDEWSDNAIDHPRLAEAEKIALDMFNDFHDPRASAEVGMAASERFSSIGWGSTVEITDELFARYGTRTFPDSFAVSVEEILGFTRTVPDILQETWDSFIAAPAPPDWQDGFPDCRSQFDTHPAIYWLRAHAKHAMQERYCQLAGIENMVQVARHDTGYLVTTAAEGVELVLSHTTVHKAGFDPRQVMDSLMDEYSPEDIREMRDIAEKRRRKRWSLMLGAIRPSRRTKGQTTKNSSSGTENTIPAVERNSMRPKDFSRVIPKPVVLLVYINGERARALLDTGSMADFMSTTLVDQLGLKKDILAKPLPVQLAVHGSRSKINCSVMAEFSYQDIRCQRRFDVVNLDNYDIILGTPFLFQHQVAIGLNPTRVSIGSLSPVDIRGEDVAVVSSAAADLLEDELEKI